MTVLFDGIPLRFWFKRHHLLRRRATVVHCEYLGRTYRSSSLCAESDIFSKAIGRRVALTRLLRVGLLGGARTTVTVPDLEFSREMRRAVWAAYFAAHRDLKVVK
jgi:hypothetical protein